MAELAARLDKVETERRIALTEKRNPAAQDALLAEKIAAEKIARDSVLTEKRVRDAALAEKLMAEKLARDSVLAEKLAKAAQESAQAAERRALEKLAKIAQEAEQAQKLAKEARDQSQQRDPAPKVAPSPDRRPSGQGSKLTELVPSRDLAPATKAVVRVYTVGDLVGDEKEGEALVKVVRAVVEPTAWGQNTGVEYLPSHKALVVRQTDKVHEEVKELLAGLGTRKKPAQNQGTRP